MLNNYPQPHPFHLPRPHKKNKTDRLSRRYLPLPKVLLTNHPTPHPVHRHHRPNHCRLNRCRHPHRRVIRRSSPCRNVYLS